MNGFIHSYRIWWKTWDPQQVSFIHIQSGGKFGTRKSEAKIFVGLLMRKRKTETIENSGYQNTYSTNSR